MLSFNPINDTPLNSVDIELYYEYLFIDKNTQVLIISVKK